MWQPKIISDQAVIGDSAETRLHSFDVDLAFTDIESSGWAPDYHEIVEIGMVRASQPDLKIVSTWESKVQLLHPERLDPQAARVNGYNPEAWRNAPSPRIVSGQFLELTRDCALAIYFSWFDHDFIYHTLKRTGHLRPDEKSPWYNVFCVMSMAKLMLRGYTPRLRSKLVCEVLGIEPEPEPHTGMAGAMQAYLIYKKLTELNEYLKAK